MIGPISPSRTQIQTQLLSFNQEPQSACIGSIKFLALFMLGIEEMRPGMRLQTFCMGMSIPRENYPSHSQFNPTFLN